jgi:hypothetical protein
MHIEARHTFFLPCKCIEAGHKWFFSALHGVAHIFSCLSHGSDETPCGGNSVDSVGDQVTSESDNASINHSYPEADECIIASCGSTESSTVPESSSDEGDQILTTSERPGRGLFSFIGEVQTRRGRSVRPTAHFSDFL